VAYFKRGPFGGSLKKEIFVRKGYRVYEQKNAINNDFSIGRYYITPEKYNEMIDFSIAKNDLIISCSGTMGRIAIVPEKFEPGIINQALLKLTPKPEKILGNYLKIILETDEVQKKYFVDTIGAAIKNVASVKVLKQIEIPLPPIEEQNNVINNIQYEEELINSNRTLIDRYEAKIATRIKSVWEDGD